MKHSLLHDLYLDVKLGVSGHYMHQIKCMTQLTLGVETRYKARFRIERNFMRILSYLVLSL
jgi:hypothetical protein